MRLFYLRRTISNLFELRLWEVEAAQIWGIEDFIHVCDSKEFSATSSIAKRALINWGHRRNSIGQPHKLEGIGMSLGRHNMEISCSGVAFQTVAIIYISSCVSMICVDLLYFNHDSIWNFDTLKRKLWNRKSTHIFRKYFRCIFLSLYKCL